MTIQEKIQNSRRRRFIQCACEAIHILDGFTDHENPDSTVDDVTGIRYDTALDVVTHLQKALLEIPEYRAKHRI